MSNFKKFQSDIKSIGGVWNTENVFFSQMRDGYTTAYKPKYPEASTKDITIQTLENSSADNKGNYELTIYKEYKYSCEYFNTIEEIKEYLNINGSN